MKVARITAPQTFEFYDLDTPEPAEGEILLKVQQVSVCGSDTHMQYDPGPSGGNVPGPGRSALP